MLQKMKRLLVVGVAALSLAFAIPAASQARGWKKPPCPSGTCGDAYAEANAGAQFGFPAVVDDKGMGWSVGGGDNLVIEAHAVATGKDQYFLWWKVADGKAFASATVSSTELATFALVFSTGEKLDTGGLSATFVKGITVLDFAASAYAKGNFGCLQTAEVALSGNLIAGAGGYALSTGPNGSGALTEAYGETTVGVEASDSDQERYDFWWIFPKDPTAEASIDGKVIVKQGLFVMAYTSPDGTTTRNFGIISGGSAIALGDANLVDIGASGQVSQQARAVGVGATAFGNSMASYEGAGGNVHNSRCVDFGSANGLAVVTGYNNVTNTGNSVSVTSHQTAYATTGSPGYQGPQ